MDIIDDGFFDEVSKNQAPMSANTEIKLPFPQEDYKETGELKRVRKSMLKKLLKCEYRYLFPVLFGFIGLMFVLMLALSFQIRFLSDVKGVTSWLAISGMLYVYSIGAVAIFAVSYPAHRYNKNFFKNEGYLTFSIPASAEEHVLAKRISAIVCIGLALLSIVVCLILFALVSGGVDILTAIFTAIGDLFVLEPVHAALFCLELVLSLAVGIFMITSALGAGNCFMSQYTGRKRIGRMTGVVVFLIIFGEGLLTSLLTSDSISWFASPVGIHVFAWLKIILDAGIGMACFFYELHFLKHKLNLK